MKLRTCARILFYIHTFKLYYTHVHTKKRTVKEMQLHTHTQTTGRKKKERKETEMLMIPHNFPIYPPPLNPLFLISPDRSCPFSLQPSRWGAFAICPSYIGLILLLLLLPLLLLLLLFWSYNLPCDFKEKITNSWLPLTHELLFFVFLYFPWSGDWNGMFKLFFSFFLGPFIVGQL
jgi:hypothetical protein